MAFITITSDSENENETEKKVSSNQNQSGNSQITINQLKDRIREMLQYEGIREHLIDEVFRFLNSLPLLTNSHINDRNRLNELRVKTEESFPQLPPLRLEENEESYSLNNRNDNINSTNFINDLVDDDTETLNDNYFNEDDEFIQLNSNYNNVSKLSRNPYFNHNVDQFENGNFEWNNRITAKLQSFGIKQFRPLQRGAVNASLAGRDLFVLLPTGGGKSLTYQLPAICSSGLTFIISPLLSLIQDQVEALTSIGIPSINISAVKNLKKVMKSISDRALRGTHLIYVTPEKITSSKSFLEWLKMLYQEDRIERFVIDEAHLVTTWGHSFRQSFREMNLLRKKFPNVPISALTATATPTAQKDIIVTLGLINPIKITASFNRTNLIYEVFPKKDKLLETLKNVFDKYPEGSGIIYCLTRKETEKLSKKLEDLGYSTGVYHAEYDNREKVHNEWREGKIRIICATVAFGMGIDKPNVRFVIHHTMPKSIEDYYQESGRAGRDGKISHCVILYSRSDKLRVLQLQDHPKAGEKIQGMIDYCENKLDCRRFLQLKQFNESFDPKDCKGFCDNCKLKSTTIASELDVSQNVRDILNLIKEGGKMKLIRSLAMTYHGSKSKEIPNKFKNLKEYGAGKSLKIQQIEDIANEMLKRGFLSERRKNKHGQPYSLVSITNLGIDFMKNSFKKFKLTIYKQKQNGILKENDTNENSTLLFKTLKVWRQKKAKEKDITSQLVIPDVPLQEISEKMPIFLEELENINGMAPPILAEFGLELLKLVRKFRQTKLNDGTTNLTTEEIDKIQSSLNKYNSDNRARTLQRILTTIIPESTLESKDDDCIVLDLTVESDEEFESLADKKRKRTLIKNINSNEIVSLNDEELIIKRRRLE